MAPLLSDDWLEKLHEQYLRGKHREAAIKRAEEAWSNEKLILQNVIPALKTEMAPRYEIKMPLGVGGVGIVLEVYDSNLEVSRALKFARPTTGRESLFAEIVASEISRLREAVHPNIIAIFQQGSVTTDGGEIPYYVMEYIPGALDAAEYFSKFRNSANLLDVIAQILNPHFPNEPLI